MSVMDSEFLSCLMRLGPMNRSASVARPTIPLISYGNPTWEVPTKTCIFFAHASDSEAKHTQSLASQPLIYADP